MDPAVVLQKFSTKSRNYAANLGCHQLETRVNGVNCTMHRNHHVFVRGGRGLIVVDVDGSARYVTDVSTS